MQLVKDRPAPQESITRLITNVELAVSGKREVIELAIVALLASGHVLFEDLPGVGKTTLALALARSVGLGFHRIQCTSDLLPSDVVGVAIYDQNKSDFTFRPGPLFANVVLVDEINRATPKTQSAMLEAMGEGTISVERTVHVLPRPFWLVATQNPLEVQGTFALPENQLDRFLLRLQLGYPTPEAESAIVLNGGGAQKPETLNPVISKEELLGLVAQTEKVRADPAVAAYIVALCQATRTAPQFTLGASTRAAVALLRACRGLAMVRGRGFVTPDDVMELWSSVIGHRVVVTHNGRITDRATTEATLREVLRKVPVPS